jgi:hypothetical protein
MAETGSKTPNYAILREKTRGIPRVVIVRLATCA